MTLMKMLHWKIKNLKCSPKHCFIPVSVHRISFSTTSLKASETTTGVYSYNISIDVLNLFLHILNQVTKKSWNHFRIIQSFELFWTMGQVYMKSLNTLVITSKVCMNLSWYRKLKTRKKTEEKITRVLWGSLSNTGTVKGLGCA